MVLGKMGDIFPPQGEQNRGTEAALRKQSVDGPRRKGLTDITNLPLEQKVSDEDDKFSLNVDQERLQQLLQENAMLMKQLVERNKIVELCGIELQKLRVNLQKSQQQNLQLAQANSQILSQLNTGKDKLKLLEHELACRNNLLTVRSSELLEMKKPVQCQEIRCKKMTSKEAGMSSVADDKKDKPSNTNSRQHSRAHGQSVAKGAMAEEDPDRRRHQTRRRSSMFKSEAVEPAKDMLATNDVSFPACPQSIDKRPEGCPVSETSQEGSEEALVSSATDIDGSEPCLANVKHSRKAKRASIVKDAFDGERFETKRPCTRQRSSMVMYEDQEDFKVDAKSVVSPQNDVREPEDSGFLLSSSVNTKDAVKEEADLFVAKDVGRIQNVKITLQDDNPCSSAAESRQHREVTGTSTAKGVSQVEKTEIRRPCPRRQSSRLKCKDEEPNACCPQNDDNEKSENHSVPLTLSENTEKMEREETDILPEQVKRTSVGRALRRAAEKVQSYREAPLNVKMRRPE